jgi:hypothetical protein
MSGESPFLIGCGLLIAFTFVAAVILTVHGWVARLLYRRRHPGAPLPPKDWELE